MAEYTQKDQPDGVPPLSLTGERTLPDVPEENYWYRRHLAVYEWIAERVKGLDVVDMACGEGYGSAVLAGRAARVTAEVDLSGLSPEEVQVEIYHSTVDGHGEFSNGTRTPMTVQGQARQGIFTFEGAILCKKSGRYGYSVRIIPRHPDLAEPKSMGLVRWAQE